MVNGQYLYRAFNQSAFQFASYSPIYTHFHTMIAVCYHARHWPNHREQLGFSILLKDTSTCGEEVPGLGLWQQDSLSSKTLRLGNVSGGQFDAFLPQEICILCT